VCFTRGHGELAIDSLAADGMSDFGDGLRRANLAPRTLASIEGGVPASCDVTVVAGAERPFAAEEVAALEALVGRGGRWMVLLGPALDATRRMVRRVGIEPLLERLGVRAEDAVVLDPAVRMSASSLAFAVDEGYADHPIVRALQGRRTVWVLARPLAAVAGPGVAAVELVRTSEAGWGETDLASLFPAGDAAPAPALDAARDRRGPLALAVASRVRVNAKEARVVVLGSSEMARNDHDVFFNGDLLDASVAWLADRKEELPIAPRTLSQLRLALDEGERARVFWICVVALPLVCVLLGVGVAWRRRA
jgi:ABC-type uncharacterized transport system involved in gliding motility auxiliary subunit